MSDQSDFSRDMKMLKTHFGDGPSLKDDEEDVSAALRFYREASESSAPSTATPAAQSTQPFETSKQPKELKVAKESISIAADTAISMDPIIVTTNTPNSKPSKTGKESSTEAVTSQTVPVHLQPTSKALDLLESKATPKDSVPITDPAKKPTNSNRADDTLTVSTDSSYKMLPSQSTASSVPIQGPSTKERVSPNSSPDSSATVPISASTLPTHLRPAPSALFENTKVGNIQSESVKQPLKEPPSTLPSGFNPIVKPSDSIEKSVAKGADIMRTAASTRESEAVVVNNPQAVANTPKAPLLEPRTAPGTQPETKIFAVGNPPALQADARDARPTVQSTSSLADSRTVPQSTSSLADSRVVTPAATQLDSRVAAQISNTQLEARADRQLPISQAEVSPIGRAQSDSSNAVQTNVAKPDSRSSSVEVSAQTSDSSSNQIRQWREFDQIKLISLPIKMPESIKNSDEFVKSQTPSKDIAISLLNSAQRPDEIRRHIIYQDEVRAEIAAVARTAGTTKEIVTIKEVLIGDKGTVPNTELRPVSKADERSDKQQLTPLPTAIKDGFIADREALREPSLKPSRSIPETVKVEEIKITKSTMVAGTAANDNAFIPWFFLTPRTTERAETKRPEKSDATRKTIRTASTSSRRTGYLVQEGDTVESITIKQLGDIRYAGLLITINRSIIRFIELNGRMEPKLRPLQMIWLPNEAERINYSKAIFTNRSPQSITLPTVSEQRPSAIDIPEVTIMNALDTVLQGIRLSGARQSVSLRDLEVQLAPATKPSKMAAEVNAIINRLADSARIITKLDSAESFNCELQLLNDGNWKTVIAYEYQRGAGKRYSCYNDGFKRPFNMDLPVSIVREMAKEDFQRNWSTYCNDFMYSQHRAS